MFGWIMCIRLAGDYRIWLSIYFRLFFRRRWSMLITWRISTESIVDLWFILDQTLNTIQNVGSTKKMLLTARGSEEYCAANGPPFSAKMNDTNKCLWWQSGCFGWRLRAHLLCDWCGRYCRRDDHAAYVLPSPQANHHTHSIHTTTAQHTENLNLLITMIRMY